MTATSAPPRWTPKPPAPNTPSHADQASRPARDRTIDVARGVAMLLVVFGHALVGVVNAGEQTAAYRFTLIMIYSTHMSLFFMISGLLSQSFADRSWANASINMLRQIVWPYLLWSFILLTAHHVMSGYTNSPLETYNPISILWNPPAVMWFLYVLFVALLIRKALAWSPDLALGAVGACIILASYVIGLPQELRFVGVVLIAAAVGRDRYSAALSAPIVGLSAVIMGITAIVAWRDAVAWSAAPAPAYPAFQAIYIPALVAGPILVMRACALITTLGGWLIEALIYVGRRTMPIFVTHILITAGSRIALTMAGVENTVLVIFTGTTLGIALPLVAAYIADRLHLSRLLGWR